MSWLEHCGLPVYTGDGDALVYDDETQYEVKLTVKPGTVSVSWILAIK